MARTSKKATGAIGEEQPILDDRPAQPQGPGETATPRSRGRSSGQSRARRAVPTEFT